MGDVWCVGDRYPHGRVFHRALSATLSEQTAYGAVVAAQPYNALQKQQAEMSNTPPYR